jgi:hypothetical protein
MSHAALYPTRESDGPAYVGSMLDARQLRIKQAHDNAAHFVRKARAARIVGDSKVWAWCMVRAAAWRQQFAKVIA